MYIGGAEPDQTTIGVGHITGKSGPAGRNQTTSEKLHMGLPGGEPGSWRSPAARQNGKVNLSLYHVSPHLSSGNFAQKRGAYATSISLK